MSYYREGYDKGYKDGSSGESIQTTWLDFFIILNTGSQFEWKQGYNDGYQDGREKFKSSQERLKTFLFLH